MFEKFTERARKVMSISRQEAQRLNSEFIGTEHMLLGIVKENGGVATKVLTRLLKGKIAVIEEEINKLITPPAVPPNIQGQLPFSPRAKRVMELAGEAGSMLGADYLGTEHILLGLIKENEGIAAQVLVNLGLKILEVRDAILVELGSHDLAEGVPSHKFDSGTAVTATFNCEPETGYMLTMTPGLSPRQVEEVLSAIRMIRGVAKIEKARGLWINHQTFEMMLDLSNKAKQVIEKPKEG
jgi:ATP-dependent Clp protease ATP-binding subunit ClpA